ncbi:MAG TPA: hypothetical protein PLP17_10460 [Oligoflexia bacterium]|nr:hypothetical protein [Oligoflexia bacterium]
MRAMYRLFVELFTVSSAFGELQEQAKRYTWRSGMERNTWINDSRALLVDLACALRGAYWAIRPGVSFECGAHGSEPAIFVRRGTGEYVVTKEMLWAMSLDTQAYLFALGVCGAGRQELTSVKLGEARALVGKRGGTYWNCFAHSLQDAAVKDDTPERVYA